MNRVDNPKIHVVIPFVRDTFMAEDNFKLREEDKNRNLKDEGWWHQGLIPLFTKDVLSTIASIWHKYEKSATIWVIVDNDMKQESLKERLSEFKDRVRIVNDFEYSLTPDVFHILKLFIEKNRRELGKNWYIIVQYPDFILKDFTRYKEIIQRLKKRKGDVVLLSFFPQEWYKGEKRAYENLNLNQKHIKDIIIKPELISKVLRDYKNLKAKNIEKMAKNRWEIAEFDVNGEIVWGIIGGIYGLRKEFIEEHLMKKTNVNLTSEYRLLEAIRYSLINESVKISIISIFGDGEFVDINYPWEHLRASDYLSRWALYDFIQKENDGFSQIFGLNDKWKIIVIKRDREPEFLDNKEKDEMWNNLEKMMKETPIKFRYTFEEGVEKSDDDLFERFFMENDIQAFLIVPSEDTKNPEELLKRNKINIADWPHPSIFGINVINKDVEISSGVKVVNSILGEGVKIMSNSGVYNSIVGNETKIYPNCLIPYAIIGKRVEIGSNAIFACEKLKKEEMKFFSGRNIVYHFARFSCLVGDNVKMMIRVSVNPGRRIGYDAKIYPNKEVRVNIPRGYVYE